MAASKSFNEQLYVLLNLRSVGTEGNCVLVTYLLVCLGIVKPGQVARFLEALALLR